MKYIALFSFLIVSAFHSLAQEFNVTVQVTSPMVEGTEKKIFETLQQELYDFVNNRQWTNYIYKPEERIEGTILITVEQRSGEDFKGKINLALRRPVYKASYNTTLFNYLDRDFEFKYIEFQPMEYADNVYSSSLTSTIAFYLYLYLGLDGDSFARMGGSPYYAKAQDIVNLGQNERERGWKAFESQKNRYWLIENLTNPTYASVRDAMYKYHRLGLDLMSDDVEAGRAGINESLELLRKANRERPGLFILQLFLEAKRDELVNIYSQASPMDKTKAVNILKEIDPANSSKYQRILDAQKQ
ncbi:MAG: DUF4835 family protein [Lentimicrobium sp.]|jgi:hypothetical protein|nr:DUF4835 family protein [Lentimicrobium sp.]MDD2528034.1 DUF4835 family protein [Lentimicrobiaceae bacterium]MDD4597663.1 DUF4835 family protein [Lentimicrobiaceae bacterium]MDY0025577.1 DUF4835 family protein [Lentimicrobium sp.]HAH57956.1 DUF4835 domain-containing protein [Bacteroidales bacterium]